MGRPRLILCNGIPQSEATQSDDERAVLELNAHGDESNVNIKITDFARAFAQSLAPRLLDLLEIASYVYATDCAVNRGNGFSKNGTLEAWGRDFKFIIPVEDAVFWQRSDVNQLLRRILGLLADDKCVFEFYPFRRETPIQGYLEFPDHTEQPFKGAERVIMFSGGLDSLAGAVETAANGSDLILVSHRPSPNLSRRQTKLYEALQNQVDKRVLHVPIWINKAGGLDAESTQRTRSFLYATLGAVVAEAFNAGGVRFFENGVVSLNLPVADEVLRARASRTTHPLVLNYFTKLVQLVTEREVTVDNPFLFKSKSEVVQVISKNGASDLIALTSSCAHQGRTASGTQYHCGSCSQCIDRRIAIASLGLEKYDPEHDYASDVFCGARREGYEQSMAVDYVAHANELNSINREEMTFRFNREISQAVRGTEQPSQDAERFIELHKRHAKTVMGVLENQIGGHSSELLSGSLPPSCMLVQIAGQKHLTKYWRRLADTIIHHLQRGLPTACQSEKPKNEPRLQEICDGILQAQRETLQREFPFMKWSASSTKPDWSADAFGLWVELKYVREKSDIRQITEDIAADITKYGDNERYTVFIIYDPKHLITDEEGFSKHILRHDMMVSFIR